MPVISWSINLDGQTNVIDLDHGTNSGKRIIYVNGVQVHKSNKFFDLGTSKHQFQIGSHKCEISIRVVSSITYNLFVNDQPQGEQHFNLVKNQPLWAKLLSLITILFYYIFGLRATFEAAENAPINFPRLLLFTISILAVNMVILIISSDQTRSIWIRFPLCFTLTLIYGIVVIILGCSCLVAS